LFISIRVTEERKGYNKTVVELDISVGYNWKLPQMAGKKLLESTGV
jgi:hypothetical protein